MSGPATKPPTSFLGAVWASLAGIWNAFKPYLFWFLLGTALVLEWIALTNRAGSGIAGKIVRDLANALLAGGFFAVVLKSLQYMGVFKAELLGILESDEHRANSRDMIRTELTGVLDDDRGKSLNQIRTELEGVLNSDEFRLACRQELRTEFSEIVYGEKFLKEWQGIRSAWSRLSQIVFRERFPAIHEGIEKAILENYFPKEGADYYVSDYKHEIILSEVDADAVELMEVVRFKICANHPGKSVTCQYHSDDDVISMKIEKLLVNNKDDYSQHIREDPKSKKHHQYRFELPGDRDHEVTRVTRRRIRKSCPMGPQRVIVFKRFVKGIEIDVRYDPKFAVQIAGNGTIEDWETLPIGTANQSQKRYTGIVFPGQGFRIYWQEKE